jgi:hypothetical protein
MDRVTDVPESFARSGDPARVNDYDSFAEAYSPETENSLVNAYYERPAMLALAGDVADRRVLDAGCGSGPLSAALRDCGAVVTGIDASAGSCRDLSTKPCLLFFVVEVPPSATGSDDQPVADPAPRNSDPDLPPPVRKAQTPGMLWRRAPTSRGSPQPPQETPRQGAGGGTNGRPWSGARNST